MNIDDVVIDLDCVSCVLNEWKNSLEEQMNTADFEEPWIGLFKKKLDKLENAIKQIDLAIIAMQEL